MHLSDDGRSTDDIEASVALAVSSELAPVCRSLTTFANEIHYSYALRFLLATIFSLGKIAQVSGQLLFGFQQTVISFGYTEKPLWLSVLAWSLVANNVLINATVRVYPIFRALLPPAVYWQARYQPVLRIPHDALIIMGDNSEILYKWLHKSQTLKELQLTDQGKEYAASFYQCLSLRVDLQTSESSEPVLISSYLDAHLLQLLAKIDRHTLTDLMPYSWGTKILYNNLLVLCYLSPLFLGMSAYVSGVTLANALYAGFSPKEQMLLGGSLALCTVVAYWYFQLALMFNGLRACCDSLQLWHEGKGLGLNVHAMSITLLTGFGGIPYGLGLGYLSTRTCLELFPMTAQAPSEVKETLLAMSLLTAAAGSVFIFSYCMYRVTAGSLQRRESSLARSRVSTPYYAWLMMAIDSTAISLGGFAGIRLLLTGLLGTRPDPLLFQSVLSASVLCLMLTMYQLHHESLQLSRFIVAAGGLAIVALDFLLSLKRQAVDDGTVLFLASFVLLSNISMSWSLGMMGTEMITTWVQARVEDLCRLLQGAEQQAPDTDDDIHDALLPPGAATPQVIASQGVRPVWNSLSAGSTASYQYQRV